MGWPSAAKVAQWQRMIESEFSGLSIERLRQPGSLGADEIKAFRALSDGSLHFCCLFVLGYDRLGGVGSFHWDFCRRVEHIDKPQLHLYYREGFKSTIVGAALPLWRAAADPEHFSYLKIVSDRELGQQHLDGVRYQVERNPVLRVLYPWLRPNPRDWSNVKASLVSRDFAKTGSTFEVRTLGQGGAGRHVTMIHADDLTNDQNWLQRAEQERMCNRLKMLWPMLDTDALVVTGTRYADYDTYGFMIENWWPALLDVFVQPVRGRGYLGPDGRLVLEGTEDGEWAHPEEWNEARLEAKRTGMADDYLFRCQYFLDTSHAWGLGFNIDGVEYVRDGELPELTVFLAADPASGKGPSQPALAAAGIDAEGCYYPLWACSDYATEAEFLDGLFGAYRLFRPVVVGIESYGQGGQSMQQQIAARCRASGTFLPLEVMTHGLSEKDVHIRQSMRPQYERGKVRHPESMRGGEYEAQLRAFPGGKLNDQIDAMAYAFRLCTAYGFLGGGERAEVRKHVTLPEVPVGYTLAQLVDPRRDTWVEEAETAGSVW